MAPKILIFGARGDPSGLDPSTAYVGDPHASARPIITDNVGVPYVRIIADSDVPGTPLAQVLFGTFLGPTYGLPVVNFPTLWSGATNNQSSQTKGATSDNFNPDPNTTVGGGVPMNAGAPNWALTHEPAVATRATITRAAIADVRHVCNSVSATFCCAAADVATGAILRLRDGATGAGTVLRSWRLHVMNAAGDTLQVDIAGLDITGSVNTAMTLEFAAAPGAASFQSVGLGGYSVGLV